MNYTENIDDSSDDINDNSYNTAGDSQLKHKLKSKHEAIANEKNPYSNKELARFINHVGFEVEEAPKFTEMMKRMCGNITNEPVKKDLTSLDDHDIIKDVSPKGKENSRNIEIRALKKLIAKYKG